MGTPLMQRQNRIKSLRKDKGRDWTQATVAVKIGVKVETISKIERGVQHITELQAHALAAAFNCSIDDLYEARPVSAQDLIEEAAPFLPDAESFESRILLREHEKWYQITKSYLGEIGYFDGMGIVIDVSSNAVRNLRMGDVVIAKKCSASRSAETIVRQFVPPSLLITNSLRGNLQPLNLNTDRVSIFGVVISPRRLAH